MPSITQETKTTLLYITIAFTFSVLMRMIWVYQFQGYEPFMFNGQFMINTNDGYYFAEGARDLLSGVSQPNDRSPIDFSGSQLTAFFVKVLPFSFESVIFYLPVFLSSLVVIPIILIAKVLKNLQMGLIAALLASIAWSYYNRTMAGYFDTDMLNIVLPMFLLWSIIWAIQTKQNIYLLLTGIDILIYRWWYLQSYSLEFSFFGLILIYTLLFDRKNLFNYKLLTIMLFAMMGLDGVTRAILVLATFLLFREEKFNRYLFYIFGVSIVTFFITGGFDPIWDRLNHYIFANSIMTSNKGLELHFFTVMQTIREAGHIPFETFANRISGHTLTFIASLVGYVYLAYRYKIMILALPMVGLGFMATIGGLRFTIYAVPILALGIAFIIVEVSNKLPTEKMRFLSKLLFTVLILLPNYKHIDTYKVPTVFNANEVDVLTTLKTKAQREDYVVAWWDYGYPIRYYSDVKTLTDGGKHEGNVNFPVSFMLTHSQKEAAKMARLDVEYTEKAYKVRRSVSNIEQMTLDYKLDDTNDFLSLLQIDIELPKKTRDIYFYLPFRMLNIYPTVSLFSNLDLMTGNKKARPLFYVSKNFKDAGNTINLGQNIYLDKKTSSLKIGKQNLPLKRFVKTAYDNKMHLHTDVKNIHPSANISVIYMSNYNTFLVVDEKTYQSMYVQLMILETYDKNLFELSIANPNAKVYKLKI